ncbi:unnamed protein product [Phytomonas sp. Hart1]|nr:unnamed protein product [Phytomonas sp. Hart1]|eukprot:CCW68049.1 unnamed protein product [Phytomonas sp. isolate Hart1]
MSSFRHDRFFIESYLMKKAEWRFAWDKRFFTLDGNRLAYRLEKDAGEKKWGTVASLDCGDIEKDGLVFSVWLIEGPCWTLRAPEPNIYEEWLKCLLGSLKLAFTVLPFVKPLGSNTNLLTVLPNAAPIVDEESFRENKASMRNDIDKVRNICPNDTDNHSNEDNESSLLSTAYMNTEVHPKIDQRVDTNWGKVLLQATVRKQMEWTGKWKTRYLSLTDRYFLSYSMEANGAVRMRATVIAFDRLEQNSVEKSSDANCFALFTLSSEKAFWVRFSTPDVCTEWYQTIHAILRSRFSWQWIPLHPNWSSSLYFSLDSSTALITYAERMRNSSDLRVHHHCAVVAPEPGGVGTALYLFGGSRQWCRNTFRLASHSILPDTPDAAVSDGLYYLSFSATYPVFRLHLAPFEERPHVKSMPAAQFGATLTALTPSPLQGGGLRLLLLGGVNACGAGLPHTEAWLAGLPLREGTAAPSWERVDLPPYELPVLAFHDALLLDMGNGNNREGGAAPHYVLITGGLDLESNCRSECYILECRFGDPAEGPTNPHNLSHMPCSLRTHFLCFLPAPRSFHRSLALSDGTVVLVGGRGIANNDVVPLLTLPAEDLLEYGECRRCPEILDPVGPSSRWKQVRWDSVQGALPPLPDVAVALLPPGRVYGPPSLEPAERIAVMAQLTTPCCKVRFFIVYLQKRVPSSNGGGEWMLPHKYCAKWVEISLRVGAVPRQLGGTTIHVYQDYLYVLGCVENTVQSLEESENEQKPSGMIRIPIGNM